MADDADSIRGGTTVPASGGPPLLMSTQYVRDLVFRVPGAPGVYAIPDLRPHITLQIDVQVRQSEDRTPVYEVALLMGCTAHTVAPVENQPAPPVAFVVELAYCGIFTVQNVPADAVEPVLFAECPRLLYPFARSVLADITRDAGFPPVLLQPFDFVAFWQNRRAAIRAQNQNQADAAAGSETVSGASAAPAGERPLFTP